LFYLRNTSVVPKVMPSVFFLKNVILVSVIS